MNSPLTRLLVFTPILLLSIATGKENNDGSDEEARAEAFWNSVYQEDHIVEISILLTKEAWEAMQPAQSERRQRGPGGQGPGGPRGEGPPPGDRRPGPPCQRSPKTNHLGSLQNQPL